MYNHEINGSDISQTIRYSKLSPDSEKDAVQKLEFY